MERPIHRNTVEFMVYGRNALFTDVLTRTGGERCTYMIPTYEALKGILHSVYWKPTLVWIIDSVRVMKPISTIRKGMRPLKYSKSKNESPNDLAYHTYLNDVCYQVRAHFVWNENRPELAHDRNEHKHHNIAKRMIERGGRRDIFLGTRECQGYVEPCVFGMGEGAYDHTGDMPLSVMYHGITYADEAECPEDQGMLTVRFWQPVMRDGIIDFVPPKDCTIKRHIRKMPIKPFGKEQQNFSLLDDVSFAELLTGGGTDELDQ